MKRTNKDKLALFYLIRQLYVKKGTDTMEANIKAYKQIEEAHKQLEFENIKRLYEQTELCVLKERSGR